MNVSSHTFKDYFITLDHALTHAASQSEMSPCRTQHVNGQVKFLQIWKSHYSIFTYLKVCCL